MGLIRGIRLQRLRGGSRMFCPRRILGWTVVAVTSAVV
jgi:hypothetical protein